MYSEKHSNYFYLLNVKSNGTVKFRLDTHSHTEYYYECTRKDFIVTDYFLRVLDNLMYARYFFMSI